MKLATFTYEARTRLGVVAGAEVIDLAAAAPDLPRDMCAFLAAGDTALAAARAAPDAAGARLPLADVHLEAPVPRPPEFIAVGLNYRDHIAETGRDTPEFPVIFNKQTSCVNGPYDAVHVPRASDTLDYEGEMAFVIGRACRHVPRDRAAEVIAGYCIVNDVSVRDWQRRSPTNVLGKGWDTHGPMGPWIVTPDEIGDPHALDIRTTVSGELRQQSNTRHLLFDCFTLVELLSTMCTLHPGTVITTGTPSGVAAAMTPPRWLQPGDTVRVEIAGIGHIENQVVPEPADTPHIG